MIGEGGLGAQRYNELSAIQMVVVGPQVQRFSPTGRQGCSTHNNIRYTYVVFVKFSYFMFLSFRAIEDRKQSIVAAEEERRKKILDERRLFQQEATERFRLATKKFKALEMSSKGPSGEKMGVYFISFLFFFFYISFCIFPT